MYKVLWDDREGIRKEMTFDSLKDAQRAVEGLIEEFDYVEISGRKTEQLFTVGIQHIQTGEKANLQVWAGSLVEATWGLWGVIGRGTQYRWTGTGPVYDGKGNVIVREFPVR